ncbi:MULTISPECIES: STAS-like domain-containing protein [Clostridium]|uniref:DUF4325 domain-containing protein n=1 Tax=Clostridium disporicum TaxID=84024 RepID=A0A174EQN1_9CLOT|nr:MULTISPECIES: STAS-like domain-containing protein [Clostridium]MCD2503033.1 STAS-like domain-containing protein [Clostridium sp. NSJ-145]CUO38270.1 Uncharacterised protein [Clostridium disporicum]
MRKDIKVKNLLGNSYSCEDAIVLKDSIRKNIESGVVLDFEGYDRISTSFLTCLFSELIEKLGREYVFKHISVKNLTNYSDYSRVVLGTTF